MFLQPSGPSPGLAHPCAWSMSLCTRESHVGAGAAPRQRLPFGSCPRGSIRLWCLRGDFCFWQRVILTLVQLILRKILLKFYVLFKPMMETGRP